jgi:hypothetical protein
MRTIAGKIVIRFILIVALTLFILPMTISKASAISLDDLLKKDDKYQQSLKDAASRKAELMKLYNCKNVNVSSGRTAVYQTLCSTKEDCLAGCKTAVVLCISNGTDKCYGRQPLGKMTFSIGSKPKITETQAKSCIERMKPECEKTAPKCEEGCAKFLSFPPK